MFGDFSRSVVSSSFFLELLVALCGLGVAWAPRGLWGLGVSLAWKNRMQYNTVSQVAEVRVPR